MERRKDREKTLTTIPLIFDWTNCTFRPPIHMHRQPVTGVVSIAVAGALGFHDPAFGISSGAQIHGTVFLIGDISKLVQPKCVCVVLSVVLLYESQVVLEHLKPLVLLSQPVVHLLVLHQPLLVHAHDLVFGVIDDGRGRDMRESEGKEEQGGYDEH